jgi:hypothetical protein
MTSKTKSNTDTFGTIGQSNQTEGGDVFTKDVLEKMVKYLNEHCKLPSDILIIPRGFAEAHGIEENDYIRFSDYIDCGGVRIPKEFIEFKFKERTFNWEEDNGSIDDESGEGDGGGNDDGKDKGFKVSDRTYGYK